MLIECLGPQGLILMPTYSICSLYCEGRLAFTMRVLLEVGIILWPRKAATKRNPQVEWCQHFLKKK